MRFLMFLAICFVVGMLIFGGNPLREFQEKQKALLAKYGSDELTITTNLFIEQQNNQGFGGLLGGGGTTEPTNETSMLNSIKSSGNISNLSRDDESGAVVKVAEKDEEEGAYVGVEVKSNMPAAATAQQAAKISNYYPPIVGQVAEAPQVQQPVVFTGKEPRLRSGQVIAFDGVYVYLVDQYGNRKPLPDGTYNLQDSSRIVVSNGRSMLK